MDQRTVLIISDEPEFSRALTGRWQSERTVPMFTLMSSDVEFSFDPDNFQLAIVGSVQPRALSAMLEALGAARKRILFMSKDSQTLQIVRDRWPGVVAMRQEENWLDTVVLLAGEMLHLAHAESRASRAESAYAQLEQQATLGRYMLDMRHTLNNSLTSVLGNSELLLLEPGSLSGGARSQVETIRNMALRIHEILQRFSSVEKELSAINQQTRKETRKTARAAV